MERRYSVFVSSTRSDLERIREAARNFIHQAGHEPVLMESFPRDFRLPWETIEREIDRSDRFILIVGDSYGHIDPETGLGFTHREFRYADQHGKSMLVFLKPQSLDNDERLLTFKRELAGRSIISWNTPEELERSFFAEVGNWLPRVLDETAGWVRASELQTLRSELETERQNRERERRHRAVLTYLFNKLNPFDDLPVHDEHLAVLPSRSLQRIGEVITAAETLLRSYTLSRLEPHMRAYVAYKLARPVPVERNGDSYTAHYRVGIAWSREGEWQKRLPISKDSNIHRVWRKLEVFPIPNASRLTGKQRNQRVPDEESVVGAPVTLGGQCIAVVGLSSPRPNELSTPEYRAVARELGTLLAALFYAYEPPRSRSRRKNDPQKPRLRAKRIRSEIASYLEEQHGASD